MRTIMRAAGAPRIGGGVAALVFAAAASPLPAGAQDVAPDGAVRRDSVTFTNGGVTLAATILHPADRRPAPAVVLVHGSGTSGRDNAWTSAYAEALVRRGIIVLHPDKRGSGSSHGDWRTASFEELAGDAAAAVRLLRALPMVDTARIAVIGFSQGGYVVPIVAAEHGEVKLVAVISGGTQPFLDQILDEITLEADRRDTPLDSAERATLAGVYLASQRFAETRHGWIALQKAVAAARERSEPLRYALRTMPADSTHWVFSWIARVGAFDPMPYWKRVRQPMLMVYGGRDPQIRTRASIERLWEEIGADAENVSIILLQGNGHAIFRDDLSAMLAEWIIQGGAR